jgi:hypothetical protein
MSQVHLIVTNNLQFKDHYALHFLTINSNVVSGPDQPFRAEFIQNIKLLIRDFKQYIKTLPGSSEVDPDPYVQILPVIEVGQKQGRIHSHMIVEIYYKGMTQIDLDKIRAIPFFDGFYINDKYSKEISKGTERLLKYIREGEYIL